jgi:hypothetical protein
MFFAIQTFGPMPRNMPFSLTTQSEAKARRALRVLARAREQEPRDYGASTAVVVSSPTREAALAFSKHGAWGPCVEKIGSVG